MATGDSQNIVDRLKSLLPARWFADDAPVFGMVAGGLADAAAAVHGFIDYARLQTRLATAQGFWLDMLAYDFLGLRFLRKSGGSDDRFRKDVKKEIFRERATRPGMAAALKDLTGTEPIIFEPANPKDTGAYGAPTMGWSFAGRYGSIEQICQVWIDVARPDGQGIPMIAGYNSPASGYGSLTDVEMRGRGEYNSLADITGPVTDLDIYRMVEAVRPAGTTMWTRISDSLPPPDLVPSYDALLSNTGDYLVMPDGGKIYISGPT